MSNEERREQDLRDEIRFHLDQEQEEREAAGAAPPEARDAARREFGNATLVQEDLRDVWAVRRWQELRQDWSYGFRSLRGNVGFSAAAILCLALGIGATTIVISIANASMFRSLPYPESERLVALYEQRPRENVFDNTVSYPDFADWRSQNHTFASMAAWQESSFSHTSTDDPEQIWGAAVTADYFTVLGVQPRVGRAFTAADESAGDASIVVVTDGFWRRSLGASEGALGRAITLNGRTYTLGGVLPPDFRAPGYYWQVFIPMQSAVMMQAGRNSHSISIVGRLKPGLSLATARQDMDVLSKVLEKEYPGNEGHYANVVPLNTAARGDLRPATVALLAAAGLVLLIACFNVANLLLARAVSRRREISVRLALGAGRGRVVRQLLTESLLLSLFGAGLGVLLALAGVFFTRSILPLHRALDPNEILIDWAVLGTVTCVAVLTGVLSGLAPALTGTSKRLYRAMQDAGRTHSGSGGRGRLRSAIVCGEAALAVMLVTGAGLLLRSFWTLQSVDPGFRAERLVTLQVSLPAGYDETRLLAFQTQLAERVRALPGVQSAGFTSFLPIAGDNSRQGLVIEGIRPDPNQEPRRANWRLITPGYIETMQIPLRAGRLFADRDAKGAPLVMLVNETAARQYWPNRDPIGTRARLSGVPDFATVVGVVGDVRHWGLEEAPRPEAYFSSWQYPFFRTSLVARTEREPETVMAAVRQALRETDKSLPPVSLSTMEQVLERSYAGRRFVMSLVVGFAAIALALAAGGIYAQLAYAVSQRRHEIGVRVALGARGGQIAGLVLRQGLGVTLLGLGLGLAGVFGLSKLIEQMLFGIQALDKPTLAAVPAVLLGVAALACVVPAWRASHADPAATLRHD